MRQCACRVSMQSLHGMCCMSHDAIVRISCACIEFTWHVFVMSACYVITLSAYHVSEQSVTRSQSLCFICQHRLYMACAYVMSACYVITVSAYHVSEQSVDDSCLCYVCLSHDHKVCVSYVPTECTLHALVMTACHMMRQSICVIQSCTICLSYNDTVYIHVKHACHVMTYSIFK